MYPFVVEGLKPFVIDVAQAVHLVRSVLVSTADQRDLSIPSVSLQPAQNSDHIDLAEQVVLKPEDDLILIFMIAERAVFFEGLFNESRFADIVILVQVFEACFPKRFTPDIGLGLSLTQHFPPGNDHPFKGQCFQALCKTISIGDM